MFDVRKCLSSTVGPSAFREGKAMNSGMKTTLSCKQNEISRNLQT
jgi:hypothetical protein